MKTHLTDGLYAAFDLGSRTIKASLVEFRSGKSTLISVECEELKPFSDFPGEKEYRDHLVQSLKVISHRLPLNECREIISLFNHREMQVKVVDLPKDIPADQVDGVLYWEARKSLPQAQRGEPFVFGYKWIRESPPEFLLCVAPLARFESFLGIFESAKIKITAAFPEVFSAVAMKEKHPSSVLPAFALINVGNANTHIQIFASGEIKFYRHIPSGLTEISANPQVRELEVFSQKIRLSFDYFRAVTKLPQVDEIAFIGGGGGHKELLGFSRDYFSPGRIVNLDLANSIEMSQVAGSLGGDLSKIVTFLPSVGAYLAHASPTSKSYNLLNRLQKQQNQEKLKSFSSSVPAMVSVFSLILGALILLAWNFSANMKLEGARQAASIAEISAAAARTSFAQKQTRIATPKISEAEKLAYFPLLRDRLSGGEILYKISQARPEMLILRSLAIYPLKDVEDILTEENLETPREEPKGPDNISDPSSENPQAMQPPAALKPLGGAGTQSETTSEDLSEGLGNEVIAMNGSCNDLKTVVLFVEKLIETRVITRYRICKTSKRSGGQFDFTIVGEPPVGGRAQVGGPPFVGRAQVGGQQ